MTIAGSLEFRIIDWNAEAIAHSSTAPPSSARFS
jgi:hypothetical protein